MFAVNVRLRPSPASCRTASGETAAGVAAPPEPDEPDATSDALSESPDAYAAFIRSETQRWGDLVRLARIEPQ